HCRQLLWTAITMPFETRSPILELPFDVISQIFVFCLPQVQDALPWRTEAPLLLIAICRQWRQLALETHELWNTIYLELKPHNILSCRPLLEFWLPRAGQMPLSLSLVYRGSKGHVHAHSNSHPLATLISDYAPHWTSIDLQTPLFLLSNFEAPQRPLASLRKLTLHSEGFYGISSDVKLCVFANTPQLRDLHLVSGVVEASSLGLPAEQITTLRMEHTTVRHALDMLVAFPNLESMTCIIWGEAGTPQSAPHASSLKSLRLILSHDRGPALLAQLTAPLLERLELDVIHRAQLPLVASFVHRSRCSLRSFSVRLGEYWSYVECMELFGSLDLLEHLEVRKGGSSLDVLFQFLLDNPLVLPSLKSLFAERTITEPVMAKVIADLLESRRENTTVKLDCFQLVSPLADGREPDSMLRITRMIEAGMEVSVVAPEQWFI
ncbi:unnamed protein product, partial [Mycena citricolor]